LAVPWAYLAADLVNKRQKVGEIKKISGRSQLDNAQGLISISIFGVRPFGLRNRSCGTQITVRV